MRKSIFVFGILVFAIPTLVGALNIDSTNKYAWGENIGWINFGSTEGDVDVSLTGMDGYAWGENVGWISLTCANTSSCGTVDYGVTLSGSDVSGYAWGENVGWISFSCANTSSCGAVDYGVTVDTATGIFSGYAWGENVGWIVFNCAETSSCGTVSYYLQSAVLATPTPSTTATPAVVLPPPPPAPEVLPPSPIATPATSPTIEPSPTPDIEVPTPESPPAEETPQEGPTNGGSTGGGGGGPSIVPIVFTTALNVVETVGGFLDGLGQSIFEPLGLADRDVCVGAVGLAACATTAAPAAVVATAVATAVAGQGGMATVWRAVLQIVGIRRRPKMWGVVYDSSTKAPIPYAKIELLDDAQRVLETRYSDRDGRYGFLSSPASLHQEEMSVRVKAQKQRYTFPAPSQGSSADYIVYDSLYFGGDIKMKSGASIHQNIPMEPTTKDGAPSGWRIFSILRSLGSRLLAFGFYIGLATVPLNIWFYPSTQSIVVGALFFGVNGIYALSIYRPNGVTRDALTGKVMPFALVTLNDASGVRQGFAVSDEYGRFILSGERGKEYEVVAYTPANIAPQRITRQRVQSFRSTLTQSWITETIRI